MRAASLLVALAFLLGCRAAIPNDTADEPPTKPSMTSFRVLKTGAYGQAAAGEPSASRGAAAAIEIASTPERYRQLWDQHIGDGAPPAVDFSRETAVFLLLGLRSTGGYSIEPQEVKLAASSAEITAPVTAPAADSIVTMAFTSPFAVLAVASPRLEAAEWIERDGSVLARTGRLAR